MGEKPAALILASRARIVPFPTVPPRSLMSLENSIGMFEIACRDGARLQHFYEKLFDWRFAASDSEGYCPIEDGSQGGIPGLLHQETHGPIETLVYVQVPNLQKALDTAERLGGKAILPPTSTVGSRLIAQFEDPEGNIIGLVLG